jgi:hypothetical protein
MVYHVQYLMGHSLEDFEAMGTRELMSHLKEVRKTAQNLSNPIEIDQVGNIKAKITAILEFREHIPNKVEAKVIRQEKAKQKKGLKGNKKRKS